MAAPDRRVSMAHRRSQRSRTTRVWSVGANAKTWTASIAAAASEAVCGQRAVLGLNLTKLARGAAKNRGIALAS